MSLKRHRVGWTESIELPLALSTAAASIVKYWCLFLASNVYCASFINFKSWTWFCMFSNFQQVHIIQMLAISSLPSVLSMQPVACLSKFHPSVLLCRNLHQNWAHWISSSQITNHNVQLKVTEKGSQGTVSAHWQPPVYPFSLTDTHSR